MRLRRIASPVVLIVAAGSLASAVTGAAASASSTLYVNNATGSHCTDSGMGAAAAPFCTVQAAVNVVDPGQTIDVQPGTYPETVTVSRSGTSTQPVTLQFHPTAFGAGGLNLTSGTALTLSGVQYVDVRDVAMWDTDASLPGVAVIDSSHVVFDGGTVLADGFGVRISGSSSFVTIQRASIMGGNDGLVVAAGVTGTVISTNLISGRNNGGGVAVVGASGTAVVSNTITDICTVGIDVHAAATSTTMENNVVANNGAGCSSTAVAESVAADSVPGTTHDYEVIFPVYGSSVRWGGATYATVAAFQAATGVGPRDIGMVGEYVYGYLPYSPTIDSADANAPGELPTDVYGNARVDDPQVRNSGTGVGYYDRGADETLDPFSAIIQDATPLGALTMYAELSGATGGQWGSTYTGTLDWGDGTRETIADSEFRTGPAVAKQHTYAKPGTYTLSFSLSDGLVTRSTSKSVTPDGTNYTPYGPTRLLDTRTGLGTGRVAKIGPNSSISLMVAGAGPAGSRIPTTVKAVSLNVTATNPTQPSFITAYPGGAALPSVSNLNFTAGTTIANSVIAPVGADGTVDFYNALGSVDLVVDINGYFVQSSADGYTPVSPDRLLDTRDGTGGTAGALGAGATKTLQIAGAAGGLLPATGIDAVLVNLTATDVTQPTFVTVYPDGSTRPNASNINVDPGQTRANAVTVPVGADGMIDLFNAGGSLDLVVDVVGYYSANGSSAYVPVPPGRLLDTRQLIPALPPGGTITEAPSVPPPSQQYPATAWVLNATVTDTMAAGYLTVYPDGVARPTASTLNWTTQSTVPNLVIAPTGNRGGIDFFNGSPGSTDLVLDEFGYFAAK